MAGEEAGASRAEVGGAVEVVFEPAECIGVGRCEGGCEARMGDMNGSGPVDAEKRVIYFKLLTCLEVVASTSRKLPRILRRTTE